VHRADVAGAEGAVHHARGAADRGAGERADADVAAADGAADAAHGAADRGALGRRAHRAAGVVRLGARLLRHHAALLDVVLRLGVAHLVEVIVGIEYGLRGRGAARGEGGQGQQGK